MKARVFRKRLHAEDPVKADFEPPRAPRLVLDNPGNAPAKFSVTAAYCCQSVYSSIDIGSLGSRSRNLGWLRVFELQG